MVLYTCEYCNNKFKTKVILARHQSRVKYCLRLQGKGEKMYSCECGKNYTLKGSLQRHKKTCTFADLEDKPEESKILIDKMLNMFRDLQERQMDGNVSTITAAITAVLASKTGTNTNTNNRNIVTNNLQPITDADLQEHLGLLTLKFIQEGAKGYADYAGCYPLRDKILCADKSRKKIRYKDEDGQVTDDGRLLARRFFQAISEKNEEILNNAYSDLHIRLNDIVAGGRAGDEDVIGILRKATSLQDILIRSGNAAKGNDDEFIQDFLGHLTKIV